MSSPKLFVLTGGPGVGKTTLVGVYTELGYTPVHVPRAPVDRRVKFVREMAVPGDALPSSS